MNLNEAKLRQLDAATTHRVYGHALDFDESAESSAATQRRRWRLISPCFCVHDSPDSPCPCMEDEPRWWIPLDAIVREGDSGRTDHSGQGLNFFDVLVDSTIMVESVQPLSVGSLKRLGGAASPEAVRELMSSGSSPLGVIFQQATSDRIRNEIGETIEGFLKFWFGAIDVAAMMEYAKEQAKQQKQ